MKAKEELNALKEEVEAVNKKLTDEELEKVDGGSFGDVFKKLDMICPKCYKPTMYTHFDERCKRCKKCKNCGYIMIIK